MALGTALGTAHTQTATAPDYSLRIAPLRLELAPGKVIDTFAYNGTVPGPVLRLREGRQVNIDIRNDTDVDDIIHWHGLYFPATVDGAMEEGSPMVERGGTQRYTFTAKPAGTRWYHSHDVAGNDLTRSLYSGMYGFLIVEPANNPGRYDQEVLLAAHHWEGSWVSMQDIRRGPPPDNGLEVMYGSASFNDKMLGHGDPIRVRDGQRVLFRLLNASPTENVTLALPGHRFTVIALDGNPVPSQRSVDTLFLAPAARTDVIVEMNRPDMRRDRIVAFAANVLFNGMTRSEQLLARGKAKSETEPRAQSARFDRGIRKIVVTFTNGSEFSFPPDLAQGLSGATDEQLGAIRILGKGAAGITEGAVFRRVFNRKAQRVTDQRLHGRAIASIVKKGAARLGFDVQAFGAHSLRSGLVTSAVKRGVSLLKICDQTRHKSIEMLRTYCRDAELFVGNAAAGLL
jgi:hypothetical protein